jgi:hypothetical protein
MTITKALPGVTKAQRELYRRARNADARVVAIESDMKNYEGTRFEADSDTIFNYREWLFRIRALVGWERGEHWGWRTTRDIYGSTYSADIPDLFHGPKPVSASREDDPDYILTEADVEAWRRCEEQSKEEQSAFIAAEKAAGRGWLLVSEAYDALTNVLDAYWYSLRARTRA